jgi:hypothetical protein
LIDLTASIIPDGPKEESKKGGAGAMREGKKAASATDLKQLLDFNMDDMKTLKDYHTHFEKIANCLMNEYVLIANKDYVYRISEIEFYFNDLVAGSKTPAIHPDTFTHGDEMQRLSGQWYFHRFGKTYKVGTYKGMDLSFGKGERAVGGILIRAINSVGALNGKTLTPNDFVEGPCNTVQRIFEHLNPAIKEVKDYVVNPLFTTDAFSPTNLHYLAPLSTIPTLKYEQRPIFRGPRVGLTLKRFDEYKPQFWMAEYRYVVHPEKHRKQQILVMLGMMGLQGLGVQGVKDRCLLKNTTVATEVYESYQRGLKNDKKVEDFRSVENMKNSHFGEVYGAHVRLYHKLY